MDAPVSDLDRAKQYEPNTDWPTSVTLMLAWSVEGRMRYRTVVISADQFFGRGEFGAPLPGDGIINMIERMRRDGPPPLPRKTGLPQNAKGKIPRNKRHAAGRAVVDQPGAAVRGKRKNPS